MRIPPVKAGRSRRSAPRARVVAVLVSALAGLSFAGVAEPRPALANPFVYRPGYQRFNRYQYRNHAWLRAGFYFAPTPGFYPSIGYLGLVPPPPYAVPIYPGYAYPAPVYPTYAYPVPIYPAFAYPAPYYAPLIPYGFAPVPLYIVPVAPFVRAYPYGGYLRRGYGGFHIRAWYGGRGGWFAHGYGAGGYAHGYGAGGMGTRR